MLKTNVLLYTMKEFGRLLITTVLLPFILVASVLMLFFVIHESFWHSKGGETKTE